VILRSEHEIIRVNALLDDGSTASYISQELADFLLLKGEKKNLVVQVLGGEQKQVQSELVTLELADVTDNTRTPFSALTMKSVVGKIQVIDWAQEKALWPHLAAVMFPSVGKKRMVDVLIGIDYPQLHSSLQEIIGDENEPRARLTPLGWTCVGSFNRNESAFFNDVREIELQNKMKKIDELVLRDAFVNAVHEINEFEEVIEIEEMLTEDAFVNAVRESDVFEEVENINGLNVARVFVNAVCGCNARNGSLKIGEVVGKNIVVSAVCEIISQVGVEQVVEFNHEEAFANLVCESDVLTRVGEITEMTFELSELIVSEKIMIEETVNEKLKFTEKFEDVMFPWKGDEMNYIIDRPLVELRLSSLEIN